MTENLEITIGERKIGQSHPVYIVAELSANHHQDFDQAVQLVQAAKDAGADAVKLQTYTADTITIASDREQFRIKGGTVWDGTTLHALYQRAYTPWDWQPKLKQVANDMGMDLFSTPFDVSAIEFLEQMDVPAHKVASFELVDIPLIRALARTGKPLLISTGMASVEEIEEALSAARSEGALEIVLLKCTSAYPSTPGEMNLRTIPAMQNRFAVPVGLSDHTMGIVVPVAGVTLGASVIEKHLTLSRSMEGPDSAFSLEPAEFKEMVKAVRTAECALGVVQFGPCERELSSRTFRRSLFVVRDIKRGEPFTSENVRSIRPGYGLHTRHLPEVLAGCAARDIERGTPVSWDLVSKRCG
ncbi:MAG TPA: pseudaminic acid synthase [Terriglobales bacterium]|nr:pseudaminic acid synthase [Terriglobales bacterium]